MTASVNTPQNTHPNNARGKTSSPANSSKQCKSSNVHTMWETEAVKALNGLSLYIDRDEGEGERSEESDREGSKEESRELDETSCEGKTATQTDMKTNKKGCFFC